MIRKKLHQVITEAIHKEYGGVPVPDFFVSRPDRPEHGDYSTNVAILLQRDLKKQPMEIAEALAGTIVDEAVEKVETAPPGFLNFFLTNGAHAATIRAILEDGDAFGRNDQYKGKRMMVEFTDPNPFKEFHIGHAMSNAAGEAIARLFEANGAEVRRANYQGDVGLHVARAVSHKIRTGAEWHTMTDLGASYVAGGAILENDSAFVKEINKKIYDRSDQAVNAIYEEGREKSMDAFETMYARLGTKFDFYFFESATGAYGAEIVREGLTKGIFERSDGAVVFRGEKYGLHTRVFLNAEGLPTYEAKELGLAKVKHDAYPYDMSFIVTGKEIVDYFKVLLAVMRKVFPTLAERTVHVPHGMLRLPGGKMSSRSGNVVSAESMLDQLRSAALERLAVRDPEVGSLEEIADAVAVGAFKFSILKQSVGSDVLFDEDRALSLEGASGPYLQYTYARLCSITRKADHEGNAGDVSLLTEPEARSVIRVLVHFPDVVEDAAVRRAPNHAAEYLLHFAERVNAMYEALPVLQAESEVRDARLLLVRAAAIILRNGLALLGIKAPERM